MKAQLHELLKETNMNVSKTLIFLFMLTLGTNCKRPVKTADVPYRLKSAMAGFLTKSLREDTSSIKFVVEDVSYFEDKDFYECEFKVRMKDRNTDTTGIMQARITRDFATVTRKQ
jgi:hypothetical protein